MNYREKLILENLKILKEKQFELNVAETNFYNTLIHKTNKNLMSISSHQFNWLNDIAQSLKHIVGSGCTTENKTKLNSFILHDKRK